VSCPTATACLAVGGYSDGASAPEKPLIERWNGHRWSIQHVPDLPGATALFPASVSCALPSSCLAVGSAGTSGSEGPPIASADWNGHRWAVGRMPLPVGAAYPQISGVSCTQASACTAVGGIGYETSHIPDTAPLAERWNGIDWSISRIPNPAGPTNSALLGVGCTPRSCTAVGGTANPAGLLIERYS
jgi:hypothetical protein